MSIFLILTVWATYVASCAPTVSVGDSGELIAAGVVLGIPHPPGYPLYTVLTHLMTVLVPLGSLGFRAALGSALAVVIATALIARLVALEWGGGILLGMGMGCLLAANRVVGGVGVQAEVYALAAAFWVATAYAWFKWRNTNQIKWGWMTLTLAAMGSAHHPLSLLLVPWLGIELLKDREARTGWWLWVLLSLIGFGSVLFLPLRSLAMPSVNWGHLVSAKDVLGHLIREQYGAVAADPGGWSESLREGWSFLSNGWRWPWVVLSMAGGLALAGRGVWHRSVWMAWGVGVSATFGVALLLRHPPTAEWRSVIEVFYLPAHVLVALGVGAAGCLISRRTPSWGRVVSGVFLVLSLGELWGSASARETWNSRTAYAFGQNILATLPAHGTFLVSGDNQLFSLVYLQQAEGYRPDVQWIEESAKLSPVLPAQALDRLADTESIRVAMWSGWEHRVFDGGPGPFPSGICYGTVPMGWREGNERWKRYDTTVLERSSQEYAHRLVALQYRYLVGAWLAQGGRESAARKILRRAEEEGGDNERFQYNLGAFYVKMGWIRDAEQVYQQAISIFPGYLLPYGNLGVLYLDQGRVKEAIELFREQVRLDPRRPDGYVNWGSALARDGRLPEAVRVWENGLQVVPGHPLLSANLERARAH